MTKPHEETSAQFEARFLKTLQDRTPREACTEAGEPADCPFCGTTPAAAYGAGEPMPMLDAGWLLCPCLGPEWVNVAEEQLRRADLDRDGRDQRYDGWRQVYWEDTQGRFDPDQFTPSSNNNGKSRKKVAIRIRQEQEWQGFPGEEKEKVERLQKLDRKVNVRVPAAVVGWLNEKAKYMGTTVSDVMRRMFEYHLIDLEEVPKVDKKRNKCRLHFCMTEQHKILFKTRRSIEGCTTAELINAVILREISPPYKRRVDQSRKRPAWVLSKSDMARFFSKINIGEWGECWEWKAGKDPKGYGQFSKRGQVQAHRVSFMLFNQQDIPKGLYVCHACDNPSCCNPEHLWLGTQKENVRDCIDKGRRKGWGEDNRAKTHCPNGHAYEGDNVVIKNGARRCRKCIQGESRRYYNKKKKQRNT